MRSDYKFSYIIREGFRIRVKAYFYEGDFQFVSEFSFEKDKYEMVKRYIRTKKLKTKIYSFNGLSDNDIRKELNKELKKDKTRTPIDEQKDVR